MSKQVSEPLVYFINDAPKSKTKAWAVVSALDSPKGNGGAELGTVKWWSHWRKYAFFPNADTLFEQLCLKEIARFCEDATRKHKQKTEQPKKGQRCQLP